MIKLLIVVTIFICIIAVKLLAGLARSSKKTWEHASALADEAQLVQTPQSEPSGSPELQTEEAQKGNQLLAKFMVSQELLIADDDGNFVPENKGEALRYCHFMMGAVQGLMEVMVDESTAEIWGLANCTELVFGVFKDGDETAQQVRSYGQTGSDELQEASVRGWKAMRQFLRAISPEGLDDDEYTRSCNELYRVVKSYTPVLSYLLDHVLPWPVA